MGSNKEILIGTVGYHLLGNHSIGPVLLPALSELDWPQGVEVDELNWGPIAVVQQFQARKKCYDRVVFLTAVERPGRAIGAINVFQWAGGLPDERQIQACIGDAATGVISIENLLVIGEYFGIWPEEVFVVDVEPGPEKPGEQLTPEVSDRIPDLILLIREIALKGTAKQKVSYLQGDDIFTDQNKAYGSR